MKVNLGEGFLMCFTLDYETMDFFTILFCLLLKARITYKSIFS